MHNIYVKRTKRQVHAGHVFLTCFLQILKSVKRKKLCDVFIPLATTVHEILPTAYKGVFVSINPRNAPCAASATMIGGAPYALKVRNCSAGIRTGESCLGNKQQLILKSYADIRTILIDILRSK
jgi:hypothetical protein